MTFQKETSHIGDNEINIKWELSRAAEGLGLTLPNPISLDQIINQDDEYINWVESNAGTHLLGHPLFVQEDPRTNDTLYDVLLFQSDSYYGPITHPSSSQTRYVLWGDAGIGSFFIRHEDLKEKRFDRVYYTWDCG